MPDTANDNARIGSITLVLGFVVLLLACTLIMTVRVHVRLTDLTGAVVAGSEQVQAMKERLAAAELQTAQLRQAASEMGDLLYYRAATAARRSPLAQVDESLNHPRPATVLTNPATAPIAAIAAPAADVAADGPAPADDVPVVPWDKAHEYLNRIIIVEGKIVDARNTGSVCFLNFTREKGGGDKFYLITFKDQFARFGGKPEDYFLNKTVRVRGRIEMHKNRPQLKIEKAEQVLKVQ
jgi:hypothetical protein